MMQMQQNANGGSHDYNEVIVDAMAWGDQLPHVIEAVFYINDYNDNLRVRASSVHAAFLSAYHLSKTDVPLLRLDLKNYERPFTLG